MTKPFYSSLSLALALWQAGSGPALALDWKSDIVLSPSAMNYSGPADSITPGHIIGPQWNATATVGMVFWCGWFILCTKSTMEPAAGAVHSGLTVELDGVSYTIFETGIPGIGYILGLKDTNATNWLPLQDGITQTYSDSWGTTELG